MLGFGRCASKQFYDDCKLSVPQWVGICEWCEYHCQAQRVGGGVGSTGTLVVCSTAHSCGCRRATLGKLEKCGAGPLRDIGGSRCCRRSQGRCAVGSRGWPLCLGRVIHLDHNPRWFSTRTRTAAYSGHAERGCAGPRTAPTPSTARFRQRCSPFSSPAVNRSPIPAFGEMPIILDRASMSLAHSWRRSAALSRSRAMRAGCRVTN